MLKKYNKGFHKIFTGTHVLGSTTALVLSIVEYLGLANVIDKNSTRDIHSNRQPTAQIFSLVRQHVEALEPFLVMRTRQTMNVQRFLSGALSACAAYHCTAPIELYEHVVSYLRMLQDFLRLVNQIWNGSKAPRLAQFGRAEFVVQGCTGEDSLHS